MFFQARQRAADRALRHAQFLGGAREIATSDGGCEGVEFSERG
jgi:hypothetical protein